MHDFDLINASMLKIVSTATRGIAQMKSIERLAASMKLYVNTHIIIC